MPVTVNAGGALAGAGSVGDVTVNAGGALAPGSIAAIGTMTVDGALTFHPGSFFAVRVLPTANDRVDVTGGAVLSGALGVFAGAGAFVPDTPYTILRSQGGVTGSFDSFTSDFTSAFLTPTLSYDPDTVFLTLTRGPDAFASAAQTPNQFSVAHALDQLPSANPVLVAVANQTLAGGRQAFDALSGEVHGSAQTAILNDSIYMRQAVLGRLRQAPFSGAAGPMAALGSGGPTIAFAESRAAMTVARWPMPIWVRWARPASRSRLRRRGRQPQIRSTPSGGKLSAPGARPAATAMPPPPAAISPVSSPGSIARRRRVAHRNCRRLQQFERQRERAGKLRHYRHRAPCLLCGGELRRMESPVRRGFLLERD